MKISYAITVCNEIFEIQQLLSFLNTHKREQDEVVVLYDETNGDPIIKSNLLKNPTIQFHSGKFDNHFANWKNRLNSYCTGDTIVNLDADEIPNVFLLENLPFVLENSDVDLIYVPRVNTVSNIGLSHVQKWGWHISKFESMIEEKELDLNNPQDLDEYNLLKEYNLIIEETISSK